MDETVLIDKDLPKSWRCPHCGALNFFFRGDNEIFMEHLILLRACDRCAYVHCWKLKFSPDFKRKVVDMLLRGDLL